MEKIITLEKERKERNISNCLSYDNKIKLNPDLDNSKFFDKAVREIAKKYFFKKTEETDNKKLIENIKKEFKHFNIQIEYVNDSKDWSKKDIGELEKIITQVQLKGSKEKPNDRVKYINELVPIKCTVLDKNNNSISFYSVLRDRIEEKNCNYAYKFNKTFIKIVDLYISLSQIYLINEILDYNKTSESVVNDALKSLDDNSKYFKSFLTFLKPFINDIAEKLLDINSSYYINNVNTYSFHPYLKVILGVIFKEMSFDNEDIILQEKQLSEMNSNYARAFEKKKNINKETLEAMKNSLFNNYFKEVEFDNDVDLAKIKQLESQFKDTLEYLNPNDKILNFIKEVTLRFRYLGKHKAAGLYFPTYKTICVDVRDPSAFLHEFMHMIDYHGYKFDTYKLSSKYNFRLLVKKYIDILDKKINSLPDTSVFKKKYNGNTKYNKAYYCNSAEIFARCGEIYLNRVLKINNSLIKELAAEDYVYPNDDTLSEMITKYYNQLFNIAKTSYKSAKANVTNISIPADNINKMPNTEIINTKITSNENGQCQFIFI